MRSFAGQRLRVFSRIQLTLTCSIAATSSAVMNLIGVSLCLRITGLHVAHVCGEQYAGHRPATTNKGLSY